MCRNVEHGGRRCPQDNSTTRRLRRNNAKLKTAFAAQVHEPLHADRVNQENVTPQVLTAAPTIVEIQAEAASIKELADFMWNGEGLVGATPVEERIVDGVHYETVHAFSEALQAKIEAETVKLGEMVALAAAAKTGFTDEMIIGKNVTAVEEAEKAYEISKKAYDDFCDEMHERFGVSKMDAPYHLKNKIRIEQLRKMEADSKGEEYVPLIDVAEVEALSEKGRALYDESSKLGSEYRTVKSTGSEEAVKMAEANRIAQHEIMQEVRNLGGSAVVHPRSNKEKVQVLNEALKFFPNEWVERSNATGENLMVKKSTARAHYTDGTSQKEYKVVKDGRLRINRKGEEPDNTRHQSGWVEVLPDETGQVSYVDEYGKTHEAWLNDGERAFFAPSWEYHSPYSHGYIQEDGKPRGRGWVKATVKDSIYDPLTQERKEEEVEVWRRPVTSRRLVNISTTAELLIDGRWDANRGKATAVHEFMHRVEAKHPYVGNLEGIFINRRTKKADGTKEDLVRIYKGKNEYSTPDNFVDDYMGKHYHGSGGKHWEVLSTGAEAVWTGAFGGLMGLGGHKVDTNHRNFVLGIFASL
jgi:hypothetical protein